MFGSVGYVLVCLTFTPFLSFMVSYWIAPINLPNELIQQIHWIKYTNIFQSLRFIKFYKTLVSVYPENLSKSIRIYNDYTYYSGFFFPYKLSISSLSRYLFLSYLHSYTQYNQSKFVARSISTQVYVLLFYRYYLVSF